MFERVADPVLVQPVLEGVQARGADNFLWELVPV